ncbi:MAG: hypothetical protein AMS19_00315 [Gemmatimonas sp. SG8_23]|jgi:hypothetical protein|nr:MAG: hypothetical protein AMS19_00315 [Gemmatimonas sp. SG8_23]
MSEAPHPRRWSRNVALLLLSATACGPAPDGTSGDVARGPEVRPSYVVRMDSESSDPAEFHLVEDDDGIRVQTGPAGIAYRPDDVVASGDMHIQATFRQYGATPGYREAFGIFVGGIDLDGPDLEYTYLLVRTTGDYLVKRRIGAITETLADWAPHPAVQRVTAEGDQPVNTLGIDVFGGQVHFVVNGDVVHVEPAGRARPHGVAGVRVNHRLDVRVDRWLVQETAGSS